MAFKNYLDLAYRRRWLILVPSVLGLAGGIVALTQMPKVYEASTRILVSSNQLNDKFTQSALSSRGVDPATLIARVQSPQVLEGIARELGALGPDATPSKIESARTWLKAAVAITYDTRTRSWYEIYAEDEDAGRAADLANRFAHTLVSEQEKVIEESIKSGLTLYLEMQDSAESKFREKDEELRAFIRSHPEVIANTYAQQQDAERQALRTAEQAIEDLKKRIEDLNDNLSSGITAALPESRTDPNDPAVQLLELRKQLNDLLQGFTERHPDVQAVQAKINALLANNPGLATSTTSQAPGPAEVPRGTLTPAEQQIRKLQRELSGWELKKQIAEQAVNRYQQLMLSAPATMQTYATLQFEVSDLRKQWQDAKQRAEQLERDQRADEAQLGERYDIPEPAKIPKRPSKPIPAQVILVGFMAGLGLGVGLAFLLEFLNPCFRSEDDFQRAYPDTVLLAAIPNLQQTARTEQKLKSGRRPKQAVAR